MTAFNKSIRFEDGFRIFLAVLVGGMLAYTYHLHKRLDKLSKKLAQLSVQPSTAAKTVKLETDDMAPVMGAKTAKVTMTIFSDFQCGYCKDFSKEILPRIKKEYVDKGLVKVEFRHLPLAFHDQAFAAAEASACVAEQGKFWEMHDYLFNNQRLLSSGLFHKWAASQHLDTTKLNACLIKHVYKSKIEQGVTAANKTGITGTPAIVINGNLTLGTREYPYFVSEINKMLASNAANNAETSCN